MHKGNIFPRARSRWCITQPENVSLYPPTWVTIADALAGYIGEGGDPPIVELTTSNFLPGRWNYHPADGKIIWQGEWTNGIDGHGLWRVGQQPSYDQISWMQAVLSIERLGSFYDIGYTSYPTIEPAHWSSLGGMPFPFTTGQEFDLPWLFFLTFRPRAMTYAEIEAIGEDPEDTSPGTWDFSV